MPNRQSVPRHAAQAYDFLAEMARAGRAPTFELLLRFCPDEPLGPPEGRIMVRRAGVGWTCGERTCWQKPELRLRERYPGYQPGYRTRERMKYGNLPPYDAPLREFARARISHAKAVWSRDIANKKTRLQFIDWLPLHVDFQTLVAPVWPDGGPGPTGGPDDKWSLSLQLLRLACGLPRFRPTTRGAIR